MFSVFWVFIIVFEISSTQRCGHWKMVILASKIKIQRECPVFCLAGCVDCIGMSQ